MNVIQKKSGQYLGTRIEQKGWKHYNESGFTTHGNGEYWIHDGCLFFQQHNSHQPIRLPLHSLAEIEVCPCQEGTGGVPIIKLTWERDGHWLSSDFVLTGLVDRNNDLLAILRAESLKH